MSLRFYMDHQVRLAVADGLRRRGVDVLTAYEDGAARLSDKRIFERAAELGRIVFTHDDDFLALADRWRQAGRSFSGLVYAHQLQVTVGKAIQDLELIAKASNTEDMRNRVEYLPLR